MASLIDITVPDIGDVTDAEIIEIPISVGDRLEIEDTLIVLETDKATMDIPSPNSGIVKEIVCQIGDKVTQDSLIIKLESSTQSETPELEPTPAPVEEDNKTLENSDENEQPSEIESEVTTIGAAEVVEELVSIEEIKVPDLGESDSVEVIEISVSVDEQIAEEDPIIVVETDKATMEIPSPSAGKIISINVAIGDKVSTGDSFASIETSQISPKNETVIEKADSIVAPAPNTPTSTAKIAPEPPVPDYPALHEATRKGLVHASPAVRRFARELGADLSTVKGTGNKGRIIKEDVRQFVKYELSRPKANANTGSFNMPEMPKNDFSKFGDIEEVPLSRIQKVSSVNLHRNWVTIPHVTQNDEADITEMDAFRKSMKDEAAAEGVRLTPLAFMMKAVVASLKAYPRFNASLANDGENLILKKYFHIGVAVDTPDGLVVPVIRDVDTKSIYELAVELGEVSVKARDKKLGIEGMQGSCFTISSLGGIGGTSFTPIVNWPDVAILGVSKGTIKPVWDGSEFQPRLMLPLSLSYDHRVVDGAVAARFITHLSRTLGDIRRLTL